jgi:hypothetical protein
MTIGIVALVGLVVLAGIYLVLRGGERKGEPENERRDGD